MEILDYRHTFSCFSPVSLSLQGSLDNISIIIVCFPGAPQLSQEALQQEAELEQQIDMKVEGELLLQEFNPKPPQQKEALYFMLPLCHL